MAKRISRKISEDVRKKMSLAKLGNKNPRYNQIVSQETRRKISESLIKYWATIPE